MKWCSVVDWCGGVVWGSGVVERSGVEWFIYKEVTSFYDMVHRINCILKKMWRWCDEEESHIFTKFHNSYKTSRRRQAEKSPLSSSSNNLAMIWSQFFFPLELLSILANESFQFSHRGFSSHQTISTLSEKPTPVEYMRSECKCPLCHSTHKCWDV